MPGRKKFKMPKINSIVGQHNIIKGELHFSGGLHLDGQVQGDVVGQQDTNSTLVISSRGSVNGDVKVANLILDGTVIGNVEADDKVQLMGGARVTGTVSYRSLEMAAGAEVNGQLLHMEVRESGLVEPALHKAREAKVGSTDSSDAFTNT